MRPLRRTWSARSAIRLYAVDTRQEAVTSYDDLTALAETRLRASKGIEVHGVSFSDVIKCMRVVHVPLTSPHFPELDIVEREDYPVQD